MKTRSTLPMYGERVTRIGRECAVILCRSIKGRLTSKVVRGSDDWWYEPVERVSVKEDWNRETASRTAADLPRRSSFSVRVTQRKLPRA